MYVPPAMPMLMELSLFRFSNENPIRSLGTIHVHAHVHLTLDVVTFFLTPGGDFRMVEGEGMRTREIH